MPMPGASHLRAASPDAGSVPPSGSKTSLPIAEITVLPRSGGDWSPDEPAPSEVRIREMRHDAVRLAPAGERPWFIVVISSDRLGHGYLARVFYEPRIRAGRLRKGTCLVLSSYTTKMKEMFEKDRKLRAEVWKSGTYYQVSKTADPFSERLDLSTQFPLPFEVTGRFEDGEIVRIVDRTRRALWRWLPESEFFRDWTRLSNRIFTIIDVSVGNKESDAMRGGNIVVRTGEDGPRPPYRGHSVTLRRAPDGLKVVGICEWRSCLWHTLGWGHEGRSFPASGSVPAITKASCGESNVRADHAFGNSR